MAASSKLMITEAERHFPVWIRVAIPANGIARLTETMPGSMRTAARMVGAMTAAGLRGVVNGKAEALWKPVIASEDLTGREAPIAAIRDQIEQDESGD